jgi:hypothetical protein
MLNRWEAAQQAAKAQLIVAGPQPPTGWLRRTQWDVRFQGQDMRNLARLIARDQQPTDDFVPATLRAVVAKSWRRWNALLLPQVQPDAEQAGHLVRRLLYSTSDNGSSRPMEAVTTSRARDRYCGHWQLFLVFLVRVANLEDSPVSMDAVQRAAALHLSKLCRDQRADDPAYPDPLIQAADPDVDADFDEGDTFDGFEGEAAADGEDEETDCDDAGPGDLSVDGPLVGPGDLSVDGPPGWAGRLPSGWAPRVRLVTFHLFHVQHPLAVAGSGI